MGVVGGSATSGCSGCELNYLTILLHLFTVIVIFFLLLTVAVEPHNFVCRQSALLRSLCGTTVGFVGFVISFARTGLRI